MGDTELDKTRFRLKRTLFFFPQYHRKKGEYTKPKFVGFAVNNQ